LRLVGAGLLVGWTLGLCLAVSATMMRLNLIDMSATLIAGALVSIPAAVLALAVVFASAPGYVAVGLIILPKVFSYARGLLRRSYAMSHVITARAKGVGAGRILLFHVLPVSGHELFALAGVSVSVALGAAIPVEALCGIPGIGDLAWRAALSRDLPLLVSLTVLVTLATVVANSTSDILTEMLWGQAA
jgi:peptide/nickel transport system permease protein